MTNASGPLTPAEAIDHAKALVPVLAERAAKTEALRRLPDETFTDLVESGLLGITQPRRFGGSELTLADAFDVINLLSQGCGSTGWTYALLGAHGWFLAQFPEQAQQLHQRRRVRHLPIQRDPAKPPPRDRVADPAHRLS